MTFLSKARVSCTVQPVDRDASDPVVSLGLTWPGLALSIWHNLLTPNQTHILLNLGCNIFNRLEKYTSGSWKTIRTINTEHHGGR